MMAFTEGIVVLCIAIVYYNCFVRVNDYNHHRHILSDKIDDVYDYVIVGGGSAGSVLASRLSEDRNIRILLIEAGGFYDENPDFHIPINSLKLQNTKHDWEYYTVPQKVSCLALNMNRSFVPRGRVLGGSSVLNSMQYTRGSRYDYDQWAANGCTGWTYKNVLPYFLKSEDIQMDELKSSVYHHTGGPMAVSGSLVTELSDLYMKAGQELGFNITDYNGADQEGFNRIQISVRNGVREATGLAFLGRIDRRANLDIVLETFVTKVDIKNSSALGVFYVRNGRKSYVAARKEVILSAGAINSPQILMLSGVGPKEHLESMNIPVLLNLPVGNNMQDHMKALMLTKINKSISLSENLLNSFWSRLKYNLFGTGPLSIVGSEGSVFYYNDQSKRKRTSADIQVMIFSKYMAENYFNIKDNYAKEIIAEHGNIEGFNFIVSITNPKSRGTVRLKSSDPFDYPLIDPQYLTDKRDVGDFIGGIRLWERFMQTKTMKELGVDMNQMKLSFCSQHKFSSDDYWECFVRHLAFTVHHHSCTCKMGADEDETAVVDVKLRVKGIKGLRVVDASVLPTVTSGNINAPVIMVAEKSC
ncbi:glucose dehydrogenase [FAD, quinone]-like [Ruditapes philippinarum]|uniref:glucose dehydrogenase [FAD, quinone]-like n=1 Tax=Ruditapes philippinarum TaxID=129788 RepID=UPI00295C119D|nr:glucose dehydrogenase [FAD, quinone]-like [Ruditapes philippinarum]XP_060557979.1 glucose dehydrogenase [FAD, quinone]-like [Ruditapes philippinarum]